MITCFIKGELITDGKHKPFGYQANEMPAICDKCLRDHDAPQCGLKDDDDPCEDFVPRYFKDTTKYLYIKNQWFKSTMGRIKGGKK